MENKEKKFMPLGWDGLFKKVYGNENKPENLEMLLSLFFNIPFEELKNKTEILNNDKILENYDDKKQSQDVVLKVFLNDEENLVNLEANIHGFDQDVINRNISYITYIFSKQLRMKKPYNEMKPVIQINFTKHRADETTTDSHKIAHTYLLTNEDGEVLTKKLQIIDIYIENCYSIWYNEDMKDFTPYEQTIIRLGALHCAKNMDEFRKCIGEIDMNDDIRKSIENDVEEYQKDSDLILVYDREEHLQKLQKSYENEHIKKMEELKKEKEQVQQEKEQVQQEKEQVQQEKEQIQQEKEQIQQQEKQIIKNLLNKNIDIETISEIIGKTIEEIKEIDA